MAAMTLAGTLPWVMPAWRLTAAQAGSLQAAFNVSHALSLVLGSAVAEQLGARRALRWASASTALAATALALFARDATTGLVLFVCLGLAFGATYAPALILVAASTAPTQRGASVGRWLAASSLGYLSSILLCTVVASAFHYAAAFFVGAAGAAFGSLAAITGLGSAPAAVHETRVGTSGHLGSLADRSSRLAVIGYLGHSWELLGMWAWMPTFLLAVLRAGAAGATPVSSVWIAAAIHLSGVLSALSAGHAADCFGSRRVLVALGLTGTCCSLAIGWSTPLGPVPVLLLAAIYAFAAFGDSPVLSSVMTRSVDPRRLAAAIGFRSVVGIGAGGLAPLAFGLMLGDGAGLRSPIHWARSFSVLAAGGVVATACAVALPEDCTGRAPDVPREENRKHA